MAPNDNYLDQQPQQDAEKQWRDHPLFRKTALFLAGVSLVSACASSPESTPPEDFPETTTTLEMDTTTSTLEATTSTTSTTVDSPETTTTKPVEEVVTKNESLSDSRFNSYEDIQATIEPLIPSELIITSKYPANLEEASKIADQLAFNITLSRNLGYGFDIFSDPLFHEPDDPSWGNTVANFKIDADLVGQKRVYEERLDYLLIEEWGDYYGFRKITKNIFSLVLTNNFHDTEKPRVVDETLENFSYFFIRDEVTLDDGSTHETWQLIKEDQI